MFRRLFYIYPALGITDLKVGCSDFGSPDCEVCFIQEESHHPHPRIGFYCVEKDTARVNDNMAIYTSTMGMLPLVEDAPIGTIEAFLSVANIARASFECGNGAGIDVDDLDEICRIYTHSIYLSRDANAVQVMEMIRSSESSITFDPVNFVTGVPFPEKILAAVAEAFAGLAMIAIHRKNFPRAACYAVAALSKHASALPFINCARIVACARNDLETVMLLTGMVIIPFLIRSNNTGLYEKELSLWDPKIQANMLELPKIIVPGGRNVKFIGDVFVEKLCKVCKKGINGEKLFRCGGCGAVYYCSKACQLGDWTSHKKAGCKTGEINGKK
jgi:hypothetical protein